jgi:hypothetical protein
MDLLTRLRLAASDETNTDPKLQSRAWENFGDVCDAKMEILGTGL